MSNQDNETVQEQQQIKKNRTMGLLVIAAVALPMLGAYFLFKTEFGIPTNTVNKGELLEPPQEIVQLPLFDESGEQIDILEGEKKWRILIPGSADCDDRCDQILYLTRQVHTRLGNKAARVERVYLNVDQQLSATTKSRFKEEYPHLKTLTMNAQDFSNLIADSSVANATDLDQRYFVMDQEGFVMMSYLPRHTGNELLTDLKRLLRYSYED